LRGVGRENLPPAAGAVATEVAQPPVLATDVAAAPKEAEAVALRILKDSARAKLVAGEPLTVEEAATIVL
jgi:hypothetical protein